MLLETYLNDPIEKEKKVNAIISAWEDGKAVGAEDIAFGYALNTPVEFADNVKLVKWLQLNSDVTPVQFRKAVIERARRDKIVNELGGNPDTASDLVALVVKRDNIECSYDGMIKQKIRPYKIDHRGVKEWITDEDLKNKTVRNYVAFHFPRHTDLPHLKLMLRNTASNLKLVFTSSAIEDAVDIWYANAKPQRLHELVNGITHGEGFLPHEKVEADTTWNDIAEKLFDSSEKGSAYVIAVLQSFMWQVKRKLYGLEVTNHLMPVILGPQGVGKTTFVSMMIEPIRELSILTSFDAIDDERNIEIWNRYIMFLDEMGHAKRDDVDAIKNAITAEVLSRRPMRSNTQVPVRQLATFIGCSNKELAQLIHDATGMRRFAPLRYSSTPDWDFANGINWSLLWRSVDENGDNPILLVKNILDDVQEEERFVGRVETWLRDFIPADDRTADGSRYKDLLNVRDRISANDLYELYRGFEDIAFPGASKTSRNDWNHEMKRIARNKPAAMIFDKIRESTGNYYVYTGPLATGEITRSMAVADAVMYTFRGK